MVLSLLAMKDRGLALAYAIPQFIINMFYLTNISANIPSTSFMPVRVPSAPRGFSEYRTIILPKDIYLLKYNS
jgi:hypothetical protein